MEENYPDLASNDDQSIVTFWKWFFRGSSENSSPGIFRLITVWCLLDIALGFFVAQEINKPLDELANSILFPLSSIFIGMSLAWGGAAQSILDSDELRLMGEFHDGGYYEYVYAFQLAVLAIFLTLVSWGVIAVGVFDLSNFKHMMLGKVKLGNIASLLIKTMLFSSISLSIRTCWRIVCFSNGLLLSKKAVRKILESQESGN